MLAFITSRIPANPLATDIVLDIQQAGMQVTGLRVSSTLLLHRLTTVSTSLIVRELGTLPLFTQAQVDNGLRLLFDL